MSKLMEKLDTLEYTELPGAWLYGVKPAAFRYSGCAENAPAALNTAVENARSNGCDSLRLVADAQCSASLPAMRPAGECSEGILLEMPLTGDCSLLPMKMHPAYRHGEMTPWGGDQLHRVFGKEIPDERTGEALELSVIPGLESVTDNGEGLHKLIAREGERLTGLSPDTPFPLLLKLLAAKGSLSVQVHPDDEYAGIHEGKLGKTEAWVILEADDNASILYGMKEGVSIEELEKGLLSGEDIEPLIARVPVKPGDVFFMPAGMVHAIGGGILLYEIQQSSDVTYRLWDFNRVNDKGEKRPLHIRQSLDVIRPELKGQQAVMPTALDNTLTPLLRVPAFALDCAAIDGEIALPEKNFFRILTALDDMQLCWEGASIRLNPGETAFIPAKAPALTLRGKGRALISAEKA